MVKPNGIELVLVDELARLCASGYGTLTVRIHDHQVTAFEPSPHQVVDAAFVREQIEPRLTRKQGRV